MNEGAMLDHNDFVQLGSVRRIGMLRHGKGSGRASRPDDFDELLERMKPFVYREPLQMRAGRLPRLGYDPSSGLATLNPTFAYGDVEHNWRVAENEDQAVQLWVSSSEQQGKAPARLQCRKFAISKVGPAYVLLGHYRTATGHFQGARSVNYLAVDLKAGDGWNYNTPIGHGIAWVEVYKGIVKVDGEQICAGDLAVFEESSDRLRLHSETDSGFVLGSAMKPSRFVQ